MSDNQGKRSRKISSHEIIYLNRKTKFDLGEYVQNPPMIRKLYEEREIAYIYSSGLKESLDDETSRNKKLEIEIAEVNIRIEKACDLIKTLEDEKSLLSSSLKDKSTQVETLQVENSNLKIELTKTVGRLEEVSRSSFVQFFVSIVATILLGFGVNIVTTAASNWTGWVLVVVSVTLSIVAFLSIRKGK